MHIDSAPALLEQAAAADPDREWFTEVGGGSLTFGAALGEIRRWTAGGRVVTMLPSGTDSMLA